MENYVNIILPGNASTRTETVGIKFEVHDLKKLSLISDACRSKGDKRDEEPAFPSTDPRPVQVGKCKLVETSKFEVIQSSSKIYI